MKLLFLVAFVAIQALSSEAMSADKKEMLLTVTMACKREAGASAMDLRELMSRALPTTHEGRCMRSCFMKKMNVIKDGKLSLDGVEEAIKSMSNDAKKVKIGKEIAESCVDVSDADECEYVGKLLACFFDAAKEKGIDGKKMFN